MSDKIKSDLSWPMAKKKLKHGQDFFVEVKVSGGKKTAVVKFTKQTHLDEFKEGLLDIAAREKLELELKLLAA